MTPEAVSFNDVTVTSRGISMVAVSGRQDRSSFGERKQRQNVSPEIYG